MKVEVARVLYAYAIDDENHCGCVKVGETTLSDVILELCAPNSEQVVAAANRRISQSLSQAAVPFRLLHAELGTFLRDGKVMTISDRDVHAFLTRLGYERRKFQYSGSKEWFECPLSMVQYAICMLKGGKSDSAIAPRIVPPYPELRKCMMASVMPEAVSKFSHRAAMHLDWDEALFLIRSLYRAERFRDAMLVASGCFLGLRLSSTLALSWGEVIDNADFPFAFRSFSRMCRGQIDSAGKTEYVFESRANPGRPMTRHRAQQILSACKDEYELKSVKTLSFHSLRKCFGRHVLEQELKNGRADRALVLLSRHFGHSSISATERYLEIDRVELSSVYEAFDEEIIV